MLEADSGNFQQMISEGLVLVDFYTPYCGPCRQLAPILENLKNIKVVKVDVSECQDIGVKQNIKNVPTLIFYKNGEQVYLTMGLQSPDLLQAKVDELNG